MKNLKLTRKKITLSIALLLIFGVVSGYFLFFHSRPVEAAWWNDSWPYRKSIPVTNNGAAGSRVYVQATIDTSDTTRFNVGCTDLRFTDINGELLPYYIVSGCRTASTVVNIYFDNLIAGLSTVYYYYGNPSASSGQALSNFQTVAPSYTVGTIGAEEQGTAPVAYWSFDEGQGTTASDETSNKNTGTLTNMSSTASSTSGWQTEDRCVSGKCLAFDGGNDYVDIPDSTSLSPTGAMAVSAWVKTGTVQTGKGVIAKSNGAFSYDYMLYFSSPGPAVDFYVSNGSGVGDNIGAITYNYADNIWHHYVAVFDGDYLKLYIDGVLKGSKDTALTEIRDSANSLKIGQGFASNYFSGLIDEPRIYSYARTAAQIKLDYNAGLSGMSGRAASKGVSVSAGQRSANWLTNGLVGYWKMDEAVGAWNGTTGEVKDWSGLGNNGTAAGTTGGAASTTAGKFGNGGSFDGVDDRVLINDPASGVLDPTNITISAWVKRNGNQMIYSRIADKSTGTGTGGYQLYFYTTTNNLGGYLENGSTNSGDINSSWLVPNNQWAHVVMTYDGSNIRFYGNGVLQKTQPYTGGISNSTNNLLLGSHGGGVGQFNGQIDDLRIYSRALSDREVRDLYNYAPGPVGWWKMDEGKGQTAYDSSGNGNNGTLGAAAVAGSDDPVWATGKNGKGLKFDGVNDYVLTASDFIGTSAVTICAWINPKSWGLNGLGRIIGNNNTVFYVNNGYVSFKSDSSTSVNSASNSISLNVWEHVCVLRDSLGIANFYVNGKTSGTANQNSGTPVAGLPVHIGDEYGIRQFQGIIDDIKVYNYARTPEQIMEDMNARGNTNEGGSGSAAVSAAGKTTVGYWKFDEGAGNSARDSSGQKNDGLIYPGTAGTNTATSSMWDKNGKFGGAMEFDGTDDSVAVNVWPINNSDNATFSFWAKRSSDTGVDQDALGANSDNKINIYPNCAVNCNGHIGLSLGWKSWAFDDTGVNALPIGAWGHYVVVVDTSTLVMYLNGRQIWSASRTGSPSTPTGFNIGKRYNSSNFFSGLIDEVKIYKYALTPDDVRAEYNAGSALKLGSFSTDTNGVASSSAASLYCVPGSSDPCSPPVAEWKFEDGKNSVTAADTSGNGNTGTIYPGTAGANRATSTMWTTGKSGKGLKFDGVDDYVASPIVSPTGSLSYSAWVYSNNNTNTSRYISAVQNSGLAGGRMLRLKDGSFNRLQFEVINDTNTIFDANFDTLTAGKWHYVVGVLDTSSNFVRIYSDGVLQNSTPITGTFTTQLSNHKIGMRPDSSPSLYWNGLIDEVRIYNYARTAAQVAWDYNRGKPIGWWKFDEGQGGVAHDSSGNNNNGTIYPGTGGTQTATSTMWSAGASGKRNGSLNFDGSDDYVNTGASALDFTGTTPRTFSLWVYPASNANIGGLINKYTTSGLGSYALNRLTDGTVSIYLVTTSYGDGRINKRTIPNALPLNRWSQMTFTWTGGLTSASMNIYINGVESSYGVSDDGGTFTGLVSNTELGLIGASNSTSASDFTRFLAGKIDDVQIFNYALTAQQVKTIYNEGAVGFR